MKRIGFPKYLASANRIDSVVLSEICFGTEFQEFASFSVPRNGIPSWFSSAEWFGTEFREFASMFHGTEFLAPLRNDLERNS